MVGEFGQSLFLALKANAPALPFFSAHTRTNLPPLSDI